YFYTIIPFHHKKSMKRIAIDMDEVIADPVWKFQQLVKRDYGIEVKRSDFRGGKIYELFPPEERKAVRGYLFEKGFFADLPVIPFSQEVVQKLSQRYEIFITTAASEFKYSLEDKYEWLQQHFPFISWKNFVFCGDKSIINADYMIDDHVKNLVSFDGHGLLFTASHNLDETRFTRVNDWLEVQAFFEAEEKK
ncbi:MAG: 5'-3'-deoxyribonucleotidase, partial [Bacteroidota bacterium]